MCLCHHLNNRKLSKLREQEKAAGKVRNGRGVECFFPSPFCALACVKWYWWCIQDGSIFMHNAHALSV